MRILVFGSGYVGLVSAVCLADSGNSVECVDVNKDKVKELNEGRSTIHEPDLETLLKRGLHSGQLKFSSQLNAIDHDVIFICVGTPDDSKGRADLSYVEEVCDEISLKILKRLPIFIKSTVPVGTCYLMEKRVNKNLESNNKDFKISISSCPEFLREGAAISDFQRPSRVIIGSCDDDSIKIAKHLFEPFLHMQGKLLIMKKESSELSKYASNAFLAAKISFINNLAIFADSSGADIDEVRIGMSDDERIGGKFLYSGIGYGGSCFPKDVKSLISQTDDLGLNSDFLRQIDIINENQVKYFSNLIKKNLKRGKRIAILGLSFKPNTDDIRYAPSIKLVNELRDLYSLRLYDPVAASNFKKIFSSDSLHFANDSYEAIKGAHAMVICTEWKNFLSLDVHRIKEEMSGNLVFDGRNCLNREKFEEAGFEYYGVGVNSGTIS